MSPGQTATAPKQPDISYTPNFDKYQARTNRLLASENLESIALPPGYPQKLESDLVWEGKGLAEKYDWTCSLNAEEIKEVEAALEHFKCKPTPK
jgi:hypothetical protein